MTDEAQAQTKWNAYTCARKELRDLLADPPPPPPQPPRSAFGYGDGIFDLGPDGLAPWLYACRQRDAWIARVTGLVRELAVLA